MTENPEGQSNLITIPQKGELPVAIHLVFAIIFLLGAVIYTISPIDIIPDILGPIGWIDDIMVWVVAIVVDLNIILKKGFQRGKAQLKDVKQKDSFI
jgi:uncharacterized membrane protein YkvA (DUF1232 family)